MIKEVKIPYKPREPFKDFHNRTERWAILVAHRRAGKTVACINDLIRRAILENKPNAQYAYVAPYYSQAKSVAWNYLQRFAEPVMAKANQSELWVELINGARIKLFGADNPDALRGNYLDGIVSDETADQRPRVWGEIIRPLLADRKGWAVFIGTPKGHNAFYEMYQAAELDPAWYCKTLRASQTKLIDDEELEDARRSMTVDQYEQEFECSFEAAILGAFYGKEMRILTDAGRVTKVEYDPLFKVNTAWDLGYSDDTTIWWFQVVHGEIRVLDYHASNGHQVSYYTDLLKAKEKEFEYVYKHHYLPHDARAKTLASGGKSIIEQFASKIPPESIKIVPSLSLQDGIQATRLALMRSWFDAEKCQDGIECLRQYQREYDEDKKIFRDKPRHDWASHGADAFRMLAIAWKEDQQKAPVDNSIRGVVVGKNEVTLDELWRTTPTFKPSGRI
jgi:hypothetical protein